MKVFISCDMEGVAGIVDWSQCLASGGAAYESGCRLLLGEVNAAIEGACDAGADKIVVNDSHGTMVNLDPEGLRRPASYISGRHKPDYMMQGLDPSYDAVLFVGYHGSISGKSSVLSHTYNPDVFTGVRMNGSYVGESGINALVAQAHAVPIALVTGDLATLEEIAWLAPGCVGVATKDSITRFSAHHLHPALARERIRDGAREAIEAVAAGRLEPPPIELPAALDLEFHTADLADLASWVKMVERTGLRSARIAGADGAAMFSSFVAVTYITRQAGGR